MKKILKLGWLLVIIFCTSASLAQKKIGYLQITTIQPGLQVEIDGKSYGMTPLKSIILPVGVHRLQVHHPEHGNWLAQDWVAEVKIEPNKTITPDILFSVHYNITSKPFGAQVLVDGAQLGATPLFIKALENESKTVTLSSAGFRDTTFTVSLAEGKFYNVQLSKSASLQPQLDFASPKKKTGNRKLLTAIGTSAVAGAFALYFRNKADDSYDRYLKTGNPELFNKHLDDAKKFDKFAAASFATFQVSFAFSFYLFVKKINP